MNISRKIDDGFFIENARRFGTEPGPGQEAGDQRRAGQRARGEDQIQGCERVHGVPRVFEEGNQIVRGHVQEVSTGL